MQKLASQFCLHVNAHDSGLSNSIIVTPGLKLSFRRIIAHSCLFRPINLDCYAEISAPCIGKNSRRYQQKGIGLAVEQQATEQTLLSTYRVSKVNEIQSYVVLAEYKYHWAAHIVCLSHPCTPWKSLPPQNHTFHSPIPLSTIQRPQCCQFSWTPYPKYALTQRLE